MASGSCLCGDFKYEFEGEPAVTVSCHCFPCRKTSGTPRSFNFIVPDDKYKTVSGTARNYVRTGDSGKSVKYSNCSNCSTLMFVEAEAFPGVKIVKFGTVDQQDFLDKHKPAAEIYTRNRIAWCEQIGGAQQTEGAS